MMAEDEHRAVGREFGQARRQLAEGNVDRTSDPADRQLIGLADIQENRGVVQFQEPPSLEYADFDRVMGHRHRGCAAHGGVASRVE